MSQPIPPPQFPVTNANGFFTSPWYLFFAQFSTQPGPIAPVVLSASPDSYTASTAGNLSISGGTISAVSLTRAGMTVNLGTPSIVPMVNNDIVRITYSVAPTVNFVPG